jgi:hypothetical protein
MAYDEGLAELMRGDLAGLPGVTEKKMFGGLCFLQNDHMVCGVHKGGGMFRVGKPNMEAALAVEGAAVMGFTGRPMVGMIDASDDLVGDDARRGAMMRMALSFVAGLPPKVAKPGKPR